MLPATLTRVLGFGSIGLAVALAGASTFGWVQTTRLGAARETISARDETIGTLKVRIANDQVLIAQRDELIDKQNQAVLAISHAQSEQREAYEARLTAANRTAQGYRARATAILAQKTDAVDELERSRAALKLIEDTLAPE